MPSISYNDIILKERLLFKLKDHHFLNKLIITPYNINNSNGIYLPLLAITTVERSECIMTDISIEKCKPQDLEAISEICYSTGYMGEDLSGRGIFEDRTLFCYLFCDYYPVFESSHCFVAVDRDSGNRIVGYIIGTDNTYRQLKNYILRFSMRIVLRMLFITPWKYPESFRAVCFMAVNGLRHGGKSFSSKDFPAHFHINILPQYQRFGIGSRLISTFESHLSEIGIKGVHLTTSNRNYKAIPFYEGRGYNLAYTSASKVWAGVDGYKSMIFVKKLSTR